MVLSSIILGACTSDKDDTNSGGEPGSVYGIVTELGTSEPMKSVGVELYKGGNLLLKTVTFDDGHFEFKDINPGTYQVKVIADGYEQTEEGLVIVETGRQARIDLQLRSTTGTIYGIVTYAVTNAPVADSEIVLHADYYDPDNYASGLFVAAKVYSDKNGGYKIEHIVPSVYVDGHVEPATYATYCIKARKDNFESPNDPHYGGYGVKIVVKAGERLQVNLQLSQDE